MKRKRNQLHKKIKIRKPTPRSRPHRRGGRRPAGPRRGLPRGDAAGPRCVAGRLCRGREAAPRRWRRRHRRGRRRRRRERRKQGGGGAQAREQQRRGGASWSLSVSDLGALVRSASAAAVTNAAAAAAAAAAAVTGVAANGGNTAAGANGGGGAASAAAAAAASATVASALPLAGLHFTLAAMTAPRPNGVSSNGSNGENAAATAALRTELAKAGARTFDARTTSGVPRDAAFALCPPGLSPEAAGILDRRADW